MKKKVFFVLALLTLVGAMVFGQVPRQQRSKRIPDAQQLRTMISNKKLDNMVLMTGGQGGFTMGLAGNAGGDSYSTPHRVTLNNFYIGMYPVTQAEYFAVMDIQHLHNEFKGNDLPIENVSWYEAIEYCNRISRKEGLTPVYTVSSSTYYNTKNMERVVTWNKQANGYRLPTEAEWEYACRAGTSTAWSTGNSITEKQAAFDAVGGGMHAKQTHSKPVPVGSYQSNPWGLYDMHGNVWEWCWDWYGKYPSSSQNNPAGPDRGELTRYFNNDPQIPRNGSWEDMRVLRGGSWNESKGNLLSGVRSACRPDIIISSLNYAHSGFVGQVGFRIARNAP